MITAKEIDQTVLEVVKYSLQSKIVPISHGAMVEIDLHPHTRYIEARVDLLFPATRTRSAMHEVITPRTWLDAWKEEHADKWYCRLLRKFGWLGPVRYRVHRLEVTFRHLYPDIKLPNKAYLHVGSIKVTNT